jgi:hypothetical protein
MQLQNIQISGGLVFTPEILTPSGDPYWANVSLLMNTTTTNDQTNNVFLDSSTNTFTVTRNGTLTQGSFTPFTLASNTSYNTSVNGGSGFFNGSTAYANVATNAAFAMGTGDFTLEAWIYYTGATPITSLNGPAIISCRVSAVSEQNNVLSIGLGGNDKLSWSNGTSWLAGNTNITANSWTHVAVTRSSSTVRLFVNGQVDGTFTSQTANLGSTRPCTIGAVDTGGTLKFTGYISGTRVVKGTAVYTSAFTPPTAPVTAISGTSLLLNFTNAGIYDAATKNNFTTLANAKVSTTQAKFGATSVIIAGGGDYLAVPDRSELEFGSGDFTIEGWIYVSSFVSTSGIISKGSPYAPYLIFIGASNEIAFYSSSNGSAWNVTDLRFATNPATATWHYIAVTRSGDTYRTFFNGVQANSVTVSGSLLDNASDLFVGRYGSSSFNGFIQDLRLTKGVARYTENFTPPTAALPTL